MNTDTFTKCTRKILKTKILLIWDGNTRKMRAVFVKLPIGKTILPDITTGMTSVLQITLDM